MHRRYLFRADNKPFLLAPRRSSWQRRQSSLGWGALLSLPAALALLPTVALLVVTPRFAHARPLGVFLLAGIAVSEAKGIARLARTLRAPFDLLSALAFGALVLLFVILMYTGIFLVSFFFAP